MTDRIAGEYHGERRALFWLALRTAILTTITLGIYRFWAKTRIRKYIWSSVAGDGDSFEYTGTGLEKFLGFLAAIVILAVYLGVLQILLFFFGLSLLDASDAPGQAFLQFGAFVLPLLAVTPLIFFAQYRARRYKLARTRWRGVRFGAEAAAWGYAWRAMAHWAVTVLSLGLLMPRQTFWLEKYMADRTWFGNAQFKQGGTWTALYPAMSHVLIGLGLIVLSVGLLALDWIGFGILAGLIGPVWLLVGLVSYRVRAFAYLTSMKTLDGQIAFEAAPKTGRIVRIGLVGMLIVALLASVILGVPGAVMTSLVGFEAMEFGPLIIPFVLLYMLGLAVVGALSLVLLTQPLIAYLVGKITIVNASALDDIRQRAGDTGADAEGFADALDVGGAI